MQALFVQIKCELGKAYEVAARIADQEIASEIYSTAGEFDLLVKFYIAEGVDIGHFVNEEVHSVGGIREAIGAGRFADHAAATTEGWARGDLPAR